MRRRNMFLAMVMTLLSVTMLMGQEWKLAKEKDGVTVHTRESVGNPIKEFKASTVMPVGKDRVVKTLLDFESYHQWYDHCKSARQVYQSADSAVYYIEMSMPFPFDNRDAVNVVNVRRNGDEVLISFKSARGIVPEKKGVVRMPVSEGSWRVTAVNENTTRIEHQFKGDPAGNVPTGMVNMFLVQGPLNTFSTLRKHLIGLE